MTKKMKIAAASLALLLGAQTSALALTAEVAVMPEEVIIEDFGSYGTSDNEQPTTDELEAVIKAVKPKLDIPADFSEFTWDYYGGSQYSAPYWNMRWSTKSDSEYYGYASVSCDKAGNLKNFNIYSDKENTNAFPVYTKNELVDTAKEYIKKVAPNANLVFTGADDAYGRYSKYYTYNFVRIENGIEYPENTATVRVDFVSGKITYCNIGYDYGIEVASAENLISPEKAAEILGTRQNMVLSYTLNTSLDENGKRLYKAVLVYTPAESYLSVDAITGEIYDERTTIRASASGATNDSLKFDAAMKEEAAEAEGGYRLTEEELAQLEVLEGLITKDQAIAKVTENDKLYLDMNLTSISATLARSYNYNKGEKNDNYVWNISFSNPFGGEKYDYSYAEAQIDAKSGEIIYFYSSMRGAYYYEQNELPAPEKKYTQEQSEKIFEDFVKTQIPEKLENTRKQNVYETNAIYYHTTITDEKTIRTPVYGAYGINYVRTNEGLDFNYDGIYGTVDAVTGKITSYNYSWTDDVIFESPKDAMTAEQALKIYFEKADFDKYYERYDVYTLREIKAETPEEKFRAFVLAIKENTSDYEAAIKKYAPDIDAKAVKQAILAADEYTFVEIAAKYFGIEKYDMEYFYNTTAELYDVSSVARLVYKTNISSVRIGALTGERVNYSGTPVTEEYNGEFSDIEGHWSQDYITILADLGIIERTEKFEPEVFISQEEFVELLLDISNYVNVDETDDDFTRIDAVKLVITALGYEKIASLDIYRTDFADNPEIATSDVGYLAIAYGLGIIDGDAGTNTFRPNENITKAEAAKLIVEATKASY